MKARVFLPSIISAILLWMAFFPLNWWPLAFLALVPFASLVRGLGIGRWRRYLAAWLGGLTFGVLSMNWVRAAHPMMALFAWPGIALFASFWWPIALFLLRRLDRLGKPPLALTLPVVWVALEYIRAHFPTGYTFLKVIHCHQYTGYGWYFLGHTQHENLPLLQTADLGGAYLASAAVACINGAAYDWAVRFRPFRWFVNLPRLYQTPIFYKEMANTAGAFCFVALLLGYGGYRLIHKPFEVGPRVTLIQENVPQNEKMGDVTALFNVYNGLCEKAANAQPKPDLIVWPETCYPFTDVTLQGPDAEATMSEEVTEDFYFQDGVKKHRPWVTINDDPKLGRVAPLLELGRTEYAKKYWRTNVLLGIGATEWDGETLTRYNSARLLYGDPLKNPKFDKRYTNKIDYVLGERYDKMHLVPFGEFVPFRKTLPILRKFTPYGDRDYSCTPGAGFQRFEFIAERGQQFRAGKDLGKDAAPDVEKEVTYRFGVLICYEDTDPAIARQYNTWAHTGKPVDFLVNMSNDGWFDGTEEHEQHLAICRFRAVEARRSVLRAVNVGISAAIDPDGRIIQLPGFIEDGWSASKKVVGSVSVDVPLDTRGSVYAALGDWVPLLCWLGIIVGLFTMRLNRWIMKTPS